MIYLLLLVLLGLLLITLFLLMEMTLLLIFMLRSLVYFFRRSEWEPQKEITAAILIDFPIGQERIFTGKYISHWEIGGFNWDQGFACQLEIPMAGGWDWRWQGLNYPQTREELTGEFDLSFRGKILEEGHFGHMGMCSYRIEVIEILIANHLT
jgi:hypothetical protein